MQGTTMQFTFGDLLNDGPHESRTYARTPYTLKYPQGGYEGDTLSKPVKADWEQFLVTKEIENDTA